MQTTPMIAMGMSSLLLTPSTSPKSSEKISGAYSVVIDRKSDPRPSITHDHERGGDVVAGAPAEPRDGQRAEDREDREPDDRVDTDEARARSPGECAVGQRMRGERGSAQDDEEPDHACDDGDDRRRFPGVEHESREHQAACVAAAERYCRWAPPEPQLRERGTVRKISVTTKKLTGQPPRAREPVVAVVREEHAEPGRERRRSTAAITAARPGRLVMRSAVAAGPMSSAVDRIAPMVTADSDTATASAAR